MSQFPCLGNSHLKVLNEAMIVNNKFLTLDKCLKVLYKYLRYY